MMEPREALYIHLRADPSVQEAVGNNIHHAKVPQGANKPLIVIHPLISRVPARDLAGVAYLITRLQVTAMAKKQIEAERAIRAVTHAVDGFRGLMANELPVLLCTVVNERQSDQDEVDEIHHHVDVIIRHKEA